MSKFIDLNYAIGQLFLADIHITVSPPGDAHRHIRATVRGTQFCVYCYRDGSRWVVKRELVEDLCEARNALG